MTVATFAIPTPAAEPPARTSPSDPARELRAYRDAAMGRDGDALRGRALFDDEKRLGCSLCHSLNGAGGKAGPDLFAVGDKFPRRDLIRAVLEPSETIAIGYGSTLVERRDGDTVLGIIKSSTPEALELIGGDGRTVRVATADILEQRGSVISLMPEGLHAGLSREQFADLIEFLVSLKEPVSAMNSHRGMPATIEELVRPIAVRPFISEDLRFSHAFVQKPGDIRSGLVWLGAMPGEPGVFLVAHQTGNLWRMEKGRGPGAVGDTKALFGDVSREIFNERGPNGLLGVAFHPRFRANGKYYLKHQVFERGRIVTTVVEREASPDRRTDAGRPSRRLWEVASATQDHSGGALGFGPDGYLYIAMGDTGPQQDPEGHGQDPTTHLGKILRIDVDRADPGLPYGIPADNPFRQTPGIRPEIWASGFREPWRFSFDAVTGELWVGDVGQDRIEEVALVRRGENHGWNVYEGFEPFSNRYRREGTVYVPPVFAYRRPYGNSITGGYVYRGDPKSSFYGVYICGDYTSRRLFGLRQENRALQVVRQIGTAPQNIASFAQDEAGNLYLVGYEGMIYQLDFSGAEFAPRTNSSPPAPR